MKKTSLNNPALELISLLTNEKLNDPNSLPLEQPVIYDECGDTLWDEVLAQEDKVLPVKGNDGSSDLGTGSDTGS